jgi:hypothetical protein
MTNTVLRGTHMSLRFHPENDHLPPELAELRRQVDLLSPGSRRNLVPLCERLTGSALMQHRLVQAAQEAVAQFQLDIKYLQFDLDATRRERDALRQEFERD